jgi:hypothetical protein
MKRQPHEQFQIVIGILLKGGYVLAFLMALLVVPLTLWLTWAHRSTVAESVIGTLLCLSFSWGWVAMLQCYRNLRKIGLDSGGRIFSSPRPDDPDELRAWKWGWHFMYAVLAGLLFMVAIPVAAWLTGK